MNEKKIQNGNPLAEEQVSKLLLKFAVPSIVAMLVGSLYNIVDQIFIGNYVGELGNAATNIAFPLTTLCIATSLLFGVGGAAAFNLNMGAGHQKTAGRFIGNAVTCCLFVGVLLTLIGEIFLKPLLLFFGSTENILPYAIRYSRITAIGFPFLIFSGASGHLIRADGKPMVAMLCNLIGAIVNTALDALFVVVFQMGMEGAALATVIGQAVSAGISAWHLLHFRTVKLTISDYIPNLKTSLTCANLGMSQGFNQIAMMIVQIVSNNSLKHYGALSVYGNDIPIAVVGISAKLAMLYFSICIGLAQALQPIASFNYGAGNYRRTHEAYRKARNAGSIVSVTAFLIFQLFPHQLIGLFGSGSELYFTFAVRYIRIFMFCTFLNNIQPLTSTFFSAIGKPKSGLFLSLTRQILFLLPLLLLLPLAFGIDGMLYAGPIADGLAFVAALVMSIREFSRPEYRKDPA